MHYLGLDHIGHKTGPNGPNMLPKQREMDGIVEMIYGAMERESHLERTLLVLAGDHGMNAGGNHGGSGPGETEPAMVFASPIFKGMEKRKIYECPTLPKEGTEFHYYTKIGQSDLVPTLAAILGMPVSKNSLGVLVREVLGLWPDGGKRLRLLRQNARQLLHVVKAKYGGEWVEGRVELYLKEFRRGRERSGRVDGEGGGEVDELFAEPEEDAEPKEDAEKLAFLWAGLSLHPRSFEDLTDLDVRGDEQEYYRFLETAQKAMSDTASLYDIPRMVLGMGISALALALAVPSFPSLWPPTLAGGFSTVTAALYGIMMFASSYVEEEQHFWYWLTPAWILLLTFTKLRDTTSSTTNHKVLTTAAAAIILLTTHRLSTRWNQTGQKHSGSPDIAHTFFPSHHLLMWTLILGTYILNGYFLHQRSFKGLFMPELAAFFTSSLVFLGVVFKLNFTQADAPELVQGLAEKLREWSEPFSLVWQARGVFGFLAAGAVGVVGLALLRGMKHGSRKDDGGGEEGDGEDISLAERLHHLLTLFLMTQTRAPNVPLFAFMELQRAALDILLTPSTNDSQPRQQRRSHALPIALSALLLSHTYYFCTGGSNSISSIDLSNAYNGVADYNIAAVGILLFAGNWAGPVWWCSAAVLLLRGGGKDGIAAQRASDRASNGAGAIDGRNWVREEREKLREDASLATTTKSPNNDAQSASPDPEAWSTYLTSMTCFVAAGLVAVMAACTVLRTHLFIWTVFSPKYLYAMAWAVGWHLVVNVGVGSLLWRLGRVD